MSEVPPPPGNQSPTNQPPGDAPPPPADQVPPPYRPSQRMSPEDERLWSTLTHVGGIFLSFVAPLVAYLVLRDRGPFVRAHTASALNFQLTMLIASVIAFVLWFVVIGILLSVAIGIVVIVFSIIAAVAANKGQYYKYPLSIPFVS